MRSQYLRLALQSVGTVRTETFMGREFKVIPAVLVREQVLNNNVGATFLPFEEIERSVTAWNGIPVVQRHPKINGQYVSARDPSVLNSSGIGFLFNAKAEESALKAEVWIDVGRLGALPETAEMVGNVEQGNVGELSTGFGASIESKKGTFNSKKYDLVAHELAPDHLALLPDEIGACSVGDGCGLGVNCSCGGAGHHHNEDDSAPKDLTLVGRLLSNLDNIRRWILGINESDEDRRQRLLSAVRQKFGGPGRDVWLDSVFSDEQSVVFEVFSAVPEVAGLFRASYTLGDNNAVELKDPERVQRVTMFEPVANGAAEPIITEGIMNRAQMIAVCLAAGILSELELNKLKDRQLQGLVNSLSTEAPAPATAAGAPAPAPAVNAAAPAPIVVPKDASVREQELATMVQELRGENATLKATTAEAMEFRKREVVRLQEELIFNGNTAYTPEEIRAMSWDDLQKVVNTVKRIRTNNAGRGGPSGRGGASFDFVKPILGEGTSVLDRTPENRRA